MPRPAFTDAEAQLIVRCVMDAHHQLAVLDGGTFVEGGTHPHESDEVTAVPIEHGALLAKLNLALTMLGWKAGDPTPPPTSEQLQTAIKMPPRA